MEVDKVMYYRNLLSTFTQVDMKGAWKLWAEDCRSRQIYCTRGTEGNG